MIRRLYNPAQLTPDELKASFVARGETLAEMLRLLREQPPDRPCQHMILVGPRGMGKTTLGLRFLHAVDDAPELSAVWQPVPFHEESYQIGDLADFWLAALRHLGRATEDRTWTNRADALARDEPDGERIAVYALAALTDYCSESGKRLILFVENLDGIIEQLRDEREVHALRATLISHPEILLLGSANSIFDAIRGHGQPLYEFFRLIILEGIEPEDTRRLLAADASREGRPEIPQALEREHGRLETIHRLTGGNPRLLALACRILIESPLGSAFEDLEQLIDEQTPFFKARIEQLPPQARKVFHCLADGWKPMLAREVADAAKLSSSHASAQIRQLVEKGYAREANLAGETRPRYEVGDRFYNIYYALRFSRDNRHRLERLVAFLQDLFGATGMRPMYRALLDAFRTDGPRDREASDWLEILAGHVAADRDFLDRDDWRRTALDHVNELLGPDAPAARRIEEMFEGRFSRSPSALKALLDAGRFAEAEKLCREVLQAQPNNLAVQTGLGFLLLRMERYEDALAPFNHVLDHTSVDTSLQSRTSIITALMGRSIANHQLRRAKAATSTSGEISAHIRASDPASLRERAARGFWSNAMVLAESGQTEEALDIWLKIPEFIQSDDPAEARRWAARSLWEAGQALAEVGQLARAVAAWRHVVEYVNDEDTAELRYEAVLALLPTVFALPPEDCEEPQEPESCADSIAAWESAANLVRPDDPAEPRQLVMMTLSLAGHVLNECGRADMAEAAFRKAVDLEPKHDESWHAWADTFLREMDHARLLTVLHPDLRALDPDHGSQAVVCTSAGSLARFGKPAEALDWIEKALQSGGTDFSFREMPGLTEPLIAAVAAGHGQRVRDIMEAGGLAEPMEPLWHAVRAELGEEPGPLPGEIADTASEIRLRFAEMRA